MTSNPNAKMGLRRNPHAFTEQGVAMLSGVLHSPHAIKVNIAIMRSDELRGTLTMPSDTRAFPYVWFWNPSAMRPLNRKGQSCRMIARGTMNSALIEFEDGFKVVASRNALRRIR